MLIPGLLRSFLANSTAGGDAVTVPEIAQDSRSFQHDSFFSGVDRKRFDDGCHAMLGCRRRSTPPAAMLLNSAREVTSHANLNTIRRLALNHIDPIRTLVGVRKFWSGTGR